MEDALLTETKDSALVGAARKAGLDKGRHIPKCSRFGGSDGAIGVRGRAWDRLPSTLSQSINTAEENQL